VAYGASHTASDSWTGIVRRSLQARFGDAGHGFILPVEPWRSYHHQDITVDSTLRLWQTLRYHAGQAAPMRFGLAGVAVESSEMRAWGRVETGERTCSRFELYYEQQPMGGSFDVLIDGRVARQVSTNAPSAVAAYEVFSVADAQHTFEIRPRGDGLVRIYGVSVEREAPGVVVDTLGINGARAASQLYWDEALWQEHLRRRVPDLVVLAYGTNESGDDEQPIETYEANLRQVIERVQRTVPMASCMLVGPSDRPVIHRDRTGTLRTRTLDVIAAQRRVARDYGCGFFDLVAWGGGPMHMMEWAAAEPAWAARDHVHFTPRAYRRMGEVITNALLQTY
jgi:lysophospholipase L1-like esterase